MQWLMMSRHFPRFWVERVKGVEARRLRFPEHVLATAAGLFIANTGGGAVWHCTAEGEPLEVYDGFGAPAGLAYDGERLYVADRQRGELVCIDPEKGKRQCVLKELGTPRALALQAGRLAVAEEDGITLYDRRTFAQRARFETPRDGEVTALARCDEGLWFIDAARSALCRILEGRVETFVGKSGTPLLQHPRGLACGIIGEGCGGGRLFIAGNGSVKAFDPQSGRMLTLLEGLEAPCGLSKQGCTLYIAETDAHRILRFDLSAMRAEAIDFGEMPQKI